MPRQPNLQSGTPTAVSADDDADVARAEGRGDVHYEPNGDQLVKAVHQVRPQALSLDTTTDFKMRGGPQAERVTDVRVTPQAPSVHEATET